jgi:ketosteroid isomerase-like protein
MADRAAVEAALQAFASGDTGAVERHIDPEFEGVVPPELSAEPDSYRGHDGVRRYFELFADTTEDLRFDTEVTEDLGEWVLVTVNLSGRGRTSGLPMDTTVYAAVLIRDDKLLRMEGFPTLEDARAAHS